MTKSWTRVLDLWDPVGPHSWPLGNVNLSDEWIFKCAQDRAALWPYDLCKAGLVRVTRIPRGPALFCLVFQNHYALVGDLATWQRRKTNRLLPLSPISRLAMFDQQPDSMFLLR